MRTKLLLSAAGLGVAGIIAASAQVYSVNVVGYIKVAVPPGFSMIANQLDAGPGNAAYGMKRRKRRTRGGKSEALYYQFAQN